MLNMEKIDYFGNYIEFGPFPEELKPVIENHNNNSREYIPEDFLVDNFFKVWNVDTPFILADNDFDIDEINNELIEIGVKRAKVVSFTGGSLYIEYTKEKEGIIIHGNSGDGYNIFILK
jgi:hypothetical protein